MALDYLTIHASKSYPHWHSFQSLHFPHHNYQQLPFFPPTSFASSVRANSHILCIQSIIQRSMDAYELDKEFQINSAQEEGYYHEYCRLFLANIALTNQVKQLLEEKGQLASRLSKYEDDEFASQSERTQEKGKRMRRNADEIERYYKCTVKTCAKSYGSEGSLNQHYKLKHPEIYLSLPNIQAVREEAEDKENRRKFVNKPR